MLKAVTKVTKGYRDLLRVTGGYKGLQDFPIEKINTIS